MHKSARFKRHAKVGWPYMIKLLPINNKPNDLMAPYARKGDYGIALENGNAILALLEARHSSLI